MATRARASASRGRPSRPIDDRLADRQLEVRRAASHGGYFESLRPSTGEKLVPALDISQPTFAGHLRTAHRQLLALLFEDPLTT